MGSRKPWWRIATVLAALELLAMAPAQAGSGPHESSAEQSPSLTEIVVTATKKGRAENIAAFLTRQNQRSEELRYAGTFGPAEMTNGLYYFEQHLDYVEQRTLDSLLLGAPPPPFPFTIAGGGIGDSSTTGLFANTD